jgi:hypothetical protein
MMAVIINAYVNETPHRYMSLEAVKQCAVAGCTYTYSSKWEHALKESHEDGSQWSRTCDH